MMLKIVMGALWAWGVAVGMSLAGDWEIQSMGGDRKVSISQKGERLTAYRVMWPEFEGEKYKLEHMYKGRVTGKAIEGDLLVREEGMKNYDVLRPFKGSIEGDGKLVLDGLPMARK